MPKANTQDIFKSLILSSIGRSFKFCEHVKGMRFVDRSSIPKQKLKIELWLDYRKKDDTMLEVMQ